MLIKRLIPYFIVVGLILPAFAFSQTEEIKDYKIQRGDTLWDISSKELQDPFLWPKIWKENPEISNPDRIYPGQSIKIPLYLLQKETIEEPIQEPVAEVQEPKIEVVREEPAQVITQPLVEKNVYLMSGYIADSIVGAGTITGSPQERNLFGINDLVYVKIRSSAENIGDKFFIIRKGQKVIHPDTNQKMGYVIEILGIAQITKFEYGQTIAKILVSFKDILTGDILDTYSEMEPPAVSKPFRKPDIEGYVLATKDLRIMNTNYDIVYIDKGQADGLAPGDILRTIAVGAHKVPNGTIQIISLKDNTATAIVISNTDAVMAGNLIMQAE